MPPSSCLSALRTPRDRQLASPGLWAADGDASCPAPAGGAGVPGERAGPRGRPPSPGAGLFRTFTPRCLLSPSEVGSQACDRESCPSTLSSSSQGLWSSCSSGPGLVCVWLRPGAHLLGVHSLEVPHACPPSPVMMKASGSALLINTQPGTATLSVFILSRGLCATH